MSETMKVEILSRETVKPSSPTPPHLRTVHLSFFDVMTPPVYTGGLLFYRINGVAGEIGDISGKLKKSLSETLTRFYPLAGRINGKVIDCNDEGAVFIEARVGSSLSDLLVNPSPSSLIGLLPDGRPRAGMWPLLLVQVTSFSCGGGFVVGICLSHRVSDATALSIFIRGWSATANGRGDTVAPGFTASRVFPSPPGQEPIVLPEKDETGETKEPEFVTRRFVFEAEKIKQLKNRASSEKVKDPTRFESITALMWRCALKAKRSNSANAKKPSVLQFPIDMRRRNISPVLSENTVGNIISASSVETDDPEMGIDELARKLREGKEKASEKLRTKEPMKIAEEFEKNVGGFFYRKIIGAIDGYSSTSWGRSGFYETDLGFGHPIWVTPDSFDTKVELFAMLDTRDGHGTEVWVSLKVEEMAAVEKDDELNQYALLNPSVV
ncbi:PREDICTED: BAHD acyltransferase At5g47980 [Tarenaya hassleriana]|uniref:BAHD acyltransferase At5g47980 n=1 Tax=Tarenaya hassleriana TaxID=28532 RepID=UPI00053C8E17|nr:PREDICTED: BAHD acyltransferase At5g47980 [Tarenaya hassleriana]